MNRLKRAWQYTRAHPWRVTAGVVLVGFLALNLLAARHAWAMTHFVPGGARTPGPEGLTLAGKARALLLGVRVRRPENQRTPADVSLAFETVQLTARDGTALEAWWIERPGAEGAAVLCHGYAASKASLLEAARELAALGWSALLLDLRGSGGSAGSTTSLGWHEALDAAAGVAWVRARARGPVVLIGSSLGAAAAARAVAVEGAQPDGLILESPFDRLLTTVEHRFEAMGLPGFPAAPLLVGWGSALGGIDGFAHAPAAYAARIDCPALVLHGARDPRVHLVEARRVVQALPQGRLHVFPDLGHVTFARQRPAVWRRVVGAFLRGLPR